MGGATVRTVVSSVTLRGTATRGAGAGVGTLIDACISLLSHRCAHKDGCEHILRSQKTHRNTHKAHKTSDVIGRPYKVGGGGADLATTTVVSSSTADRAIGAATFRATGAGAAAALGVCTIGAGAAGRVRTGDAARLTTRIELNTETSCVRALCVRVCLCSVCVFMCVV